jgi:hypothetical protein
MDEDTFRLQGRDYAPYSASRAHSGDKSRVNSHGNG